MYLCVYNSCILVHACLVMERTSVLEKERLTVQSDNQEVRMESACRAWSEVGIGGEVGMVGRWALVAIL